LVTDNHIHLIG